MSQFELFKKKDILQCVKCGGQVSIKGDGAVCEACGAEVPIEDGVPLFSIDEIRTKGTGTTEEKRSLRDIRRKYPFLVHLERWARTPGMKSITRGEDPVHRYIEETLRKGDAVIVDVGAGGRHIHPDVVALDIYNFPGVDLCARADNIPLRDGSVDMVISTCALEHMDNTGAVLSEMQRILKPGGFLFCTAPFIYPYHPEPFDLMRWSYDGLAKAFPTCEKVESGSYFGPHYTMYVILSAYFSWLLSFGNYNIYLAWKRIFNWVFIPFKVLHCLHGLCPKRTPLDSIVYYVGRKL